MQTLTLFFILNNLYIKKNKKVNNNNERNKFHKGNELRI